MDSVDVEVVLVVDSDEVELVDSVDVELVDSVEVELVDSVDVVDSVVVEVVLVDDVVGLLTMIAPSITSTYSEMSEPSVAEMNLSLYVTGYVPASQSSGTVYVSLITTAPSSAATASPVLLAKPYSNVVLLSTTVALYASEPLTDV